MGRSEDKAKATTLSEAKAPTLANDVTAPSAASSTDDEAAAGLSPGDHLGRYLLLRRLGAGAMGVVWEAKDPRLDRKIAIKVVHPRLARTAEASARLLREARAMAKVSHDAVVTVHDAGEVDGRLYVAMELVEGTTLGQLFRSRSAEELADWRRWLALILEAGRGLVAAHRQGVLHRDFKPDNVLVDRDGRACVADFGLASLGTDASSHTPAARDSFSRSVPLDLTSTGMVLGTPVYMSPQQLRGEPVDERADQFAFCVAAWEAVYGERPFAVEEKGVAGIAELAATIESSSITLPPATSRVPSPIRDVLMRGLSADAEARWPDMDTLVRTLTEATSRRRRRASTARRVRRRWIVGTAIVAAAIAAAGVAWKVGSSHAPVRATSRTTASTPLAPAKKLFPVSLRTKLALTQDGKRMALGGSRLEVRDVDGAGYWSAEQAPGAELAGIEIEGDVVRYGRRDSLGVWTWHYRSGQPPQPPTTPLPGFWFGHTTLGDIVYVGGPQSALTIMADGREIRRWPTTGTIEIVQISPDHTRVAYLDGNRFDQRLVIHDLARGHDMAIGPSSAFTAVTWRDDHTLLYATGTVDRPQIFQVNVGETSVGPPTVLHELETGWIGSLAATRDQVMYIEMGLSSRTRVIERPALATRDFDSASVAAPLGWKGPDELLAWDRSSHRVDRQSMNGSLGPTTIVLPTEPANATVAGDTLIASLRGNDGRTTVALSLSTGKQLWQHVDARTLAVRCAADRAAPCFAIRIANDVDRVQHIDPQTGALGDVVFEAPRLEDVAVAADGSELAISSTAHAGIMRVTVATKATTKVIPPMTAVRSVAYDHDGALLIAGTVSRNTYRAGYLASDGRFDALVQTENDMLSTVRPSPDGSRVLMLSRSYAPSLWLVR